MSKYTKRTIFLLSIVANIIFVTNYFHNVTEVNANTVINLEGKISDLTSQNNTLMEKFSGLALLKESEISRIKNHYNEEIKKLTNTIDSNILWKKGGLSCHTSTFDKRFSFNREKFEHDINQLNLGNYEDSPHLFSILSLYTNDNGSEILKDIIHNAQSAHLRNKALYRFEGADTVGVINKVLVEEKNPSVLALALARAEEYDDLNDSLEFLISIENFIYYTPDSDLVLYEEAFEQALVYLERHTDKEYLESVLLSLKGRNLPEPLQELITDFF